MNYLDCFRAIARRRTDQVVVTSAGNSSQAWWAVTRDSEASFYLDASMSLSTMFASGLALAQPDLNVWAFMGDGAFCMNPGMLMVERQMNLRNLVHFLVSNRVYGATSNARCPTSPATITRQWRAPWGSTASLNSAASMSSSATSIGSRPETRRGTPSRCSKSSHFPKKSRGSSSRRSTGLN